MLTKLRSARAPRLHELGERLGFENLFFFPYILTFVWQYFCAVENKLPAWMLATIVSVAIWCAYAALRPADKEKLPREFWLIVGLPLVIAYSLRVISPDVSFDVMNYHIFHAERALRGPLLPPQDFFPTPAPFNPAPDILTGLYRHLLGYRLGTIANLLALIWTGMILNRFLRDYVHRSWLRSVGIIGILCTEQILFQINNYMIDLLALPLLLEATRLSLAPVVIGEERSRSAIVALLLGISVAFKLANLAFAFPIALMLLFNLLIGAGRRVKGNRILQLGKLFSISALIFAAPLLPFLLSIYRLTGNPFFPLYNAAFKSPYWPPTNVFDPRWGPRGVKETLLWPILIFFEPQRFCEFPVYSGRISLGFLAAAVCLILTHKERNIRGLCMVTLLGSILWSAASGYSRYAIYLELTSGIILVWLVQYLWQSRARVTWIAQLLPQVPLWLLLVVQVTLALSYANQYEWSMRETIFRHRWPLIMNESKYLLRDRALVTFLANEDRRAITEVGAWIESTYKTTALMALLKPDIPVVGVRSPQYFVTIEARQKFAEALSAASDKRLFTLTDGDNLQSARQSLAAHGLAAGSIRVLSIPFFSQSTELQMLLVEVVPAPRARQNGEPAAKGAPLPDNAFRAMLTSEPPAILRRGEKYIVEVTLKNESAVTWPGQQSDWQYQITVGNRWLDERGTKVNDLDGRAALVDNLGPGDSVKLPLTITAPAEAGNYLLQIDAIQESVAWFGDRGSPILSLKVKVD